MTDLDQLSHTDHDQPYSEEYLQAILKSVKTIAMVGASPDKTKFSYGVLRVLHETGYDMIPVNPRPEATARSIWSRCSAKPTTFRKWRNRPP